MTLTRVMRTAAYRHPAMRRSAKRSRKAAKPHGETSPAQKAFATVGSAVRDGASTGLLSANLNVAPILFFNAFRGLYSLDSSVE